MPRADDRSLELRAAWTTVFMAAVQALALLGAAGSLRYPGAWLYLLLQVLSMTLVNGYLARHDRELLRRRLAFQRERDADPTQRVFVALLGPLGLTLLVVAGLERRLEHSLTSSAQAVLGGALFCAGAYLMFAVLRVNRFSSSLITVEPEQSVVMSGPYQHVRHPMYSGMLMMIAAAPLTLGSSWAWWVVLPLLGLFVVRLRAEESFLSAALPGYVAYMSKTRARLVPWVW